MRLLVTGGAGFIGSAVVRRAIAAGHAVLNVDKLTYAANLANLKPVDGHPSYRFVKADVCDRPRMQDLFASFRPDIVMNLAAETHVDRSIDDPADFITTNIIGTFSLLQAARAYVDSGAAPARFRFHHVSTDEVFGELGEDGLFGEDTPYRPNSPYSASKASGDMMVRAWGRTYRLPVSLSNCSNNYGPFQYPEKLVPVAILAAHEARPIPVYGDGLNIRDWLYVDDHADALLLLAENGRAGETYMIGGRSECTNLDLVHRICAAFDRRKPDALPDGHQSLITFVEDRPGHDRRYAIDCSKVEREFGWKPSVCLDTGLECTIDWYLDNGDWLADLRRRGYSSARLGLAVAQDN